MNLYFCLIAQHSAKFLTFMDDSWELRHFQARLGKLEVQESRQSMSATDISAHIEEAPLHGFREVSKEAFDFEQIKARADLEKLIFEPEDSIGRIVAWDDLEADYRVYFRNNPTELLSSDLKMFRVHHGPCHLNADLRMTFDSFGPTSQTSRRNLIFNDGLRIDGNFDAGDCTTELPLLVIVKGDLHVNNLILSGWAEVVVTGNVFVAETIFGFDGEAGGRLHVQGNLSAKRIYSEMMYSLEVDGQVEGMVYWGDFDEPTLPGASIVPNSLTSEQATDLEKYTPFVREAYFASSNWATGEEVQTLELYTPQIVEMFRQGKSIFR